MQLNLKISRKNSKGCAAPSQEIRVLSSWNLCTSSPTFYKRRWNVHWMYSPNSTYHRNILSTKKIHHSVLGGSLSEKKKEKTKYMPCYFPLGNNKTHKSEADTANHNRCGKNLFKTFDNKLITSGKSVRSLSAFELWHLNIHLLKTWREPSTFLGNLST